LCNSPGPTVNYRYRSPGALGSLSIRAAIPFHVLHSTRRRSIDLPPPSGGRARGGRRRGARRRRKRRRRPGWRRRRLTQQLQPRQRRRRRQRQSLPRRLTIRWTRWTTTTLTSTMMNGAMTSNFAIASYRRRQRVRSLSTV
jgi:hypothetical protein